MAQTGSASPNSLPGIVTDQPEIFESEPTLSDDTGVNDLDLTSEPADEAIALIEVPIKQAFAFFAERENEIAKFYVQRHGEYKISGDKPEEETDIEKYHRLVSEVNQLLNKFQTDKAIQAGRNDMSIAGTALTSNLEVLSRQLKALEFAAEDGTLNPTQAGYLGIKSKLDNLRKRVESGEDDLISPVSLSAKDETAKLIRMGALEKRLNMLETLLGSNEDKIRAVFKTTKRENLVDAAEALGTWLSLMKPETVQRINDEIDCLTQRLEDLNKVNTGSEKHLDSQNRQRLEHLYSLVTSTDKYRALVPNVIHRLSSMEELQQKASRVSTTVSHLEQVQSSIMDNLQSNKDELTALTDMFAKNIDFIKEFSKDIDSRITALRDRDH